MQNADLYHSEAPLELYCWRAPEEAESGWNVWQGNPFNGNLEAFSKEAQKPFNRQMPATRQVFLNAQNYFVEYHLEFFRQQHFAQCPSRLNARLLFLSRVDALLFYQKHQHFLKGKILSAFKTQGTFTLSLHDSAWLDYLHLPQSFSLDDLNRVASYYWGGKTVEEIAPLFNEEVFYTPSVIEALVGGNLRQNLSPLLFCPAFVPQ